MILNEHVNRKIIPVAGGKGGVGKSVLSVNLALSLAKSGKRTVLVDLDLGGSNVHTLLGEKNTHPGIGNFVSDKSLTIPSLVCETEYENFAYVPGDVLAYGLGDLTKNVRKRLSDGLLDLDADYVIVDLGSGSNFTIVDFFLISNSGLVVTTPQHTSVLNAYSFLKNMVFRFLLRAFASDAKISSYLKRVVKEKKPGSAGRVIDILDGIEKINPSAREKAEAFLDVLQPKLILNKGKSLDDISIARGLHDLVARNLSVELECLGTVLDDPLVGGSVDKQAPFVMAHPESVSGQSVDRMALKIIQSNHFPHMPLELDYYADTFELAQIEMENDLSTTKPPNEEGDYEVDQLLELLKMQQERIQELQGTVRMLSMN
ncbi:MAG: P-loop NTPase [Spirochaetales bacterium]|nr:P-loop NTPase [Spirochaetales bacterium]